MRLGLAAAAEAIRAGTRTAARTRRVFPVRARAAAQEGAAEESSGQEEALNVASLIATRGMSRAAAHCSHSIALFVAKTALGSAPSAKPSPS